MRSFAQTSSSTKLWFGVVRVVVDVIASKLSMNRKLTKFDFSLPCVWSSILVMPYRKLFIMSLDTTASYPTAKPKFLKSCWLRGSWPGNCEGSLMVSSWALPRKKTLCLPASSSLASRRMT